ncbi:MAG: fibronectin type III domain-containing protein, partial [Calditrichaceae bacterium]
MKYTFFFFLLSFLLLLSCQPELILKEGPQYDYTGMDKQTIDLHKKFEKFIQLIQHYKDPFELHPHTRIEEIIIDPKTRRINVRFSQHFAYFPFREENVITLYQLAREQLDEKYSDYKLTLSVGEYPIEQLVPNYFRDRLPKDPLRLPKEKQRTVKPIVTRLDKWIPEKGLYNRNIGLWHSHGWYYDYKKDRWEWQRARLFQTVEDLLPLSFTIPYLIPMLENAGAQVFIPRERDIQTNEVIIDNNTVDNEKGLYIEVGGLNNRVWINGNTPGFAEAPKPYPLNLNLFRLGTYQEVESDSIVSAKIQWIPNIPEEGNYAVYISYFGSQENADDVLYTVYHTGGKTRFLVNQQIGGQMWVYLGQFKFDKGTHAEKGMVEVVNLSGQPGKLITADAVRFGGGMGNIIRNDWNSQRPRFMEGSRYYLQYDGMPDTLVHNLSKNGQDYINDINSRSEYINYLNGAPNGPNKNRDLPGLGIPIDMTLAFHTDAGITDNDSTIGTMLIYSTTGADTQTVFPDSVSRIATRDFADIVQTQLLNDIKKTFNPEWNRRRLLDARYSEAFRPNVPGVLLELLSHQNFEDMKYANDPRFRFMISRAIYKGVLKFITSQNVSEFVVQPLPVDHFQATFDTLGSVILKWQPVNDPLEPSAVAEKYKVYTRVENSGFDNGFIVDEPKAVIEDIIPGLIYSFKITALNAGGESFP